MGIEGTHEQSFSEKHCPVTLFYICCMLTSSTYQYYLTLLSIQLILVTLTHTVTGLKTSEKMKEQIQENKTHTQCLIEGIRYFS